jgi:hypothetical protein
VKFLRSKQALSAQLLARLVPEMVDAGGALKVKLLMWRVAHNNLPLKLKITSRNIFFLTTNVFISTTSCYE